jgi:molybdopterin/thiamine biosynthesis adenylyltransferase
MTARAQPDRLRRAAPSLEAHGIRREALGARVLAGGCGSLASLALETLLRLGIRELVVIDFDEVEDKDVVQSAFLTADVGRPKVEALAALARRVGSPTRVVPLVDDVRRFGAGTLRGFDGVLCALDTLEARLDLHAEVHAAGVPFLDGGVDGHDGRITEIAAAGACFACGQGALASSRQPGWDRIRRLSAEGLGCRAGADPARPTIAAPYATREVAAALAGRALHALAGRGASQELRFGWTPQGLPHWRRFELERSSACACCGGLGFDPQGVHELQPLAASARRDSLGAIEGAARQVCGAGSLEAPLPWSAFGQRPPAALWNERPALELGVALGGRLAFVRSDGERCWLELAGDGDVTGVGTPRADADRVEEERA